MSVTTTSKESAAEAIMQLRTFTCVGTIDCSGVTEQEDENGVKQVSFDISVTYGQNGTETQDADVTAE